MTQKLENMGHFSFKEVSKSKIEKELRDLNVNKATRFGNIPNKFKKKAVNIALIYYKNYLMMHLRMLTSQIN